MKQSWLTCQISMPLAFSFKASLESPPCTLALKSHTGSDTLCVSKGTLWSLNKTSRLPVPDVGKAQEPRHQAWRHMPQLAKALQEGAVPIGCMHMPVVRGCYNSTADAQATSSALPLLLLACGHAVGPHAGLSAAADSTRALLSSTELHPSEQAA